MTKKARKKIFDRGLHHERTLGDHHQSARERAFAETWREEAKEIVHALFVPQHRARNPFSHPMFSARPILRPSRLERMMIATMMQWLGSNVGFSFLERSLKKCGYSIVPTEKLREANEGLK